MNQCAYFKSIYLRQQGKFQYIVDQTTKNHKLSRKHLLNFMEIFYHIYSDHFQKVSASIEILKFQYQMFYIQNQLMNSKKSTYSIKSINHNRKHIISQSPSIRLSKSQTKLDKAKQQIDLSNYRIILNKMLSIQKYDQLISYSIRFIPKQVLQCNSKYIDQSNFMLGNKIGQKLISDGIYIRHLIQLALNHSDKSIYDAWIIINYFKKAIKINKRIFKDFAESIKIKNQQNKSDCNTVQKDDQISQLNAQEKSSNKISIEVDFLGWPKSRTKIAKTKNRERNRQNQSKVKIKTFQEYAESHKKQIQQSMKIVKARMQADKSQTKKQIQRISNMLGNIHSPIKRKSIRQSHTIHRPIQKLNQRNLYELPIIEQQVIKKYFPNINSIARQNYGVKIVGQIKKLGVFEQYQLVQVGIEYTDSLETQNEQIIDFAVTMKPMNNRNQSEDKRSIECNQIIRIFLTKQ